MVQKPESSSRAPTSRHTYRFIIRLLFSAIVCGLAPSESVMVTVPVSVLVALGVNVTLIVQLLPPATDHRQLSVSAKFPLATRLVTGSAVVARLLRVADFTALVVLRPGSQRSGSPALHSLPYLSCAEGRFADLRQRDRLIGTAKPHLDDASRGNPGFHHRLAHASHPDQHRRTINQL
jgi:hypothetical protein